MSATQGHAGIGARVKGTVKVMGQTNNRVSGDTAFLQTSEGSFGMNCGSSDWKILMIIITQRLGSFRAP